MPLRTVDLPGGGPARAEVLGGRQRAGRPGRHRCRAIRLCRRPSARPSGQPAAPPAPSVPPARAADAGTAILSGTEMLPTPVLAELFATAPNCVRCAPVPRTPKLATGRRPRSRISSGARDLTCRFPGCTMPAERCDIDHVVPYPIGATHAANLACLCRKHHHLKTFWTGDWALALLPDGAAIWTSPTGRTYTTHPGSRSHFPQWDTTTGGLPLPRQSETFSVGRGLMMPRRNRTRAAERAARIKAEREQKDQIRIHHRFRVRVRTPFLALA